MSTLSSIQKIYDPRLRKGKTLVFTEDQFNKEKEEARAEGYQSGMKDANLEATQRQETLQRELLYNLHLYLDKSIEEQKAIQNKVSDLVLNLALALFRKTLPAYSSASGLEEVISFIETQLATLKDLPELTITVHPKIVESIDSACKKIKVEKSLTLQFFIKGSDEFEPTDCQINWQNGSVEKRLKDIIKDISTLIFNPPAIEINAQEK